MWADYPIFGGYGKRQDIAFDSQDLLNLFSIESIGGKKRRALIGSPGLKEKLTVVGNNARPGGLFEFFDSSNQEILFSVLGNTIYRINTSYVQTKIGVIGTESGPISITANNANQIIFVDGQTGYTYDVNSGVFGPIASAGFPAQPLNVVFLDGYFVVPDLQGDRRQYQISALNDGTKWDALDEAEIQAYPGQNVGVGVVNRRLYFFKTDSTEVWYNNGSADFPFRRDNNLLFNFGCLARASIASGFGYLFWLARDKDGVGSVMMTTGQEAIPISDESIDNLIAGFTNPSDMDAYIYKDLGHIFYVMSWTTDDVTLVYNLNLKEWGRMEMQRHAVVSGEPYSGKVRHISNCHAYFNGKHIVGSYKAPTLYEFSRQYFDNFGEPIRRMRTPGHFFDPSYRMLQINSIQVDMQMGLGLETSDDASTFTDQNDNPLTNPKIFMRTSKDGGNTFGNMRGASIGKIGNRRARAIFRKLGVARDLVTQFEIFVPVGPIAILGASINYEVLPK